MNEIFINPSVAHYTAHRHAHAHTDTHKQTKPQWALPDCDLFADAGELHPFVCSHSSRTAQYAFPQLIKMLSEFPSRSILARARGLAGQRLAPLTLLQGKWMQSNEARLIMKLLSPR